MPQFSMIPERKRILEKIPDYAVTLKPAGALVTVKIGASEVARSSNALLVQETKHRDVYYLPRKDVDMSALTATDHQTYCPFKGRASYWSVGTQENIAWSYEAPYPEVDGLKDYVSFYADRAEINVG